MTGRLERVGQGVLGLADADLDNKWGNICEKTVFI